MGVKNDDTAFLAPFLKYFNGSVIFFPMFDVTPSLDAIFFDIREAPEAAPPTIPPSIPASSGDILSS